MEQIFLDGSSDCQTIDKIEYCQVYLVDLLNFIVQENSNRVKKSTSLKEVNSLPELGRKPIISRVSCSSRSLPALAIPAMSEKGNFEGSADLERKKSHHFMQVLSDSASSTPNYSDDFDESCDDETNILQNDTDKVAELIQEENLLLKDGNDTKQKPKDLSSAITELEDILINLKANLEKRNEDSDFMKNNKELEGEILVKDAIIKDLQNKLQETAAVVEERSEVVGELLKRLQEAEEAMNEVKADHVHVCDSVKDWYSDMERSMKNKDCEILRLAGVIDSLGDRLKKTEDSATRWRVKYLNIEANHLNLKKNLATGRGASVVSPVRDLIPVPPDVKRRGSEEENEATLAISQVRRANERQLKNKDSPYNLVVQPTFITELSPRDSSHKKHKSRKHGSSASSSAPTHPREHLPRLKDKKKRRLKDSVRRAYGLPTAEEDADRSPRRVEMRIKTYSKLPSIAPKRK